MWASVSHRGLLLALALLTKVEWIICLPYKAKILPAFSWPVFVIASGRDRDFFFPYSLASNRQDLHSLFQLGETKCGIV